MTANCAPLIYADVLANNGVVHVVDSVLPPADQSLQQLILSRRQLSTFSTSTMFLYRQPEEQVAQLWQRDRTKLDAFAINVQR